MKLIKLLFWIALIVVISYFLTDIKIADKTIKQHIDYWMQKTDLVNVKKETYEWIEKKSGGKLTTIKSDESKKEERHETLTDNDQQELKKLLQQNQ